MTTIHQITTAQELLQATALGRCELVRGELIMMTPAGAEHGQIVMAIAIPLGSFVKQRGLGVVFGAETGFHIGHAPDTVRAPDVAFVRAERVPPGRTRGFYPGAPDLAVEVVSPGDRASEVLAKAQDWLDAGCRAVWVIDPDTRTATVYRSLTEIAVLRVSDRLTCEDLLPGFSLPVGELFA
jgi:Uma2 family endonuclease